MFPSYTLDVAGNIRATGNLRVEGITTHTVSAKMHFGDIGKGLSYSGKAAALTIIFLILFQSTVLFYGDGLTVR
jgi:hypothetical protein